MAVAAAAVSLIFNYSKKIGKRQCWVHLILHYRSMKGRPKKVFAGFGWLFDRRALHLDGECFYSWKYTIEKKDKECQWPLS